MGHEASATGEQERRALAGLAALVLGDGSGWSAFAGGPGQGLTPSQWLHLARVHGVSELIANAWAGRSPTEAPAEPGLEHLLDGCRSDLRSGAAFEMLRQHELRRVLGGLHAAGAQPLILKGSALAYGLYAAPALRPRGDSDLLTPPGSEKAVEQALTALGYGCDSSNPTELILTQTTWSTRDKLGATHYLDMHRTANNSPLLAQAFSYGELKSEAVALPALGPHALGLGDVDALLLACMHRAGHVDTPYFADGDTHHGGDRLIWFYDMHLLLQRMTGSACEAFVDRARRARLAGICHDALSLCVELLHTPVPAGFIEALGKFEPAEPSAVYLRGSSWSRAWKNWLALPDWRQKMLWTSELAFPSEHHMRRKYPGSPGSPLIWLYARRAWGGLSRWIRG